MSIQASYERRTRHPRIGRVSFRLRFLGLSMVPLFLTTSWVNTTQAATRENANNPWQVSQLPAELGQVGPLATNTNGPAWKPLNLGTSASTFAIGPSGEEYMANSAGIWQWESQHWNYVSGTADLGLASNGYANSPMTVTPQGDLIVAVKNQIWQFHNGKPVVISDGHESNIAFLTWMPNGTLVAGLNVYPNQKKTSNNMLGGPAPIPSLKMMGYSNHEWNPIPLDIPKNVLGAKSAAWSPSANQVALAFNSPQVMVKSPDGWKSLSLPTENSQMEYVTSVAWAGNTLLAGTTNGIWQYKDGLWSRVSVNGMSHNTQIIQLMASGDLELAVGQNPDNSTAIYLCSGGVWRNQPLHMTNVNFIGQSPTGIPVLETENQARFRQLYQYTGRVWPTIPMNGFPSESYVPNMPQPFYWPKSLAWAPSGVLTVSSLYNGIWQLQGDTWKNVGGPVVKSGPYVSGSIGWLPNGDLDAIIRRDVPPLPKTPSLQEDSVTVYRNGHWSVISDPPGIRPNLFTYLSMGPHGEVVMAENKGTTINLWLWQGGPWKEIKNVTASVGSAQIGGISFDSKGDLILDMAGLGRWRPNGLYKWTGGHWVQILKNAAPLQVKDTYWFHHTSLPEGGLLFSVMNDSGYHLLENKNGQWTNLGLDGQDVVEMGPLPGNKIYAISQEGVCWIRTL